MSSSLAGQHVVVLGLGTSGLAAAELAILQGAVVTVLDTDSNPRLQERADHLAHRGAKVILDWGNESWTAQIDLAIISPGIAPGSVLGRLAAAVECPVISELEFGFRSTACPILAITGTNGKTTTTELTVHCLKGLGYRVLAAGNIGLPLCEAARRSAALDFLVVEVSSFQLEHAPSFAPLAAALLNVTDDHLDRYSGSAAYLDTKLRIFQHIPRADHVVLNRRLLAEPAVRALCDARPGAPVTFTGDLVQRDATWFLDDQRRLCVRSEGGAVTAVVGQDEIRLLGRHNLENIAAAMALCGCIGASPAELAPHVKRFAPSPHRLELVATRNQVAFINDSKATNPDAVIQAIQTVAEDRRWRGKIVLVAGGRDKAMNFAPLLPWIKAHVKTVLLLGESRKALAELWGDTVPCHLFTSLRALVEVAVDVASPGDVVLLSPGCASQDMFKDYTDRGNQFAQEVRRRLGE